MSNDLLKAPRLYVTAGLTEGSNIILPETQGHYLKNVMRLSAGDDVRIFNGRDGEWHARVEMLDKKKSSLTPVSQVRAQSASRRPIHLLFAPIKKARLDWLIEKTVELGVTDLHPVISQQTDVRQMNQERTEAQIIEAAEQCERLDIPHLHELAPLKSKLGNWSGDIPLFVAMERAGAPLLKDVLPATGSVAFLIGPEGGFSAEEREWPGNLPFLKPVSLGPDILRSETAAAYVLAAAHILYM